jgi:predicted GIY-YIG superfamily endonuclease
MSNPTGISTGMCSKRPGRRAALRAIQLGEPFLYCLSTRQGALKFGISRDVAMRIGSHIKFGGTDRLLAFRPGTLAEEQAIHERLAPYALPYEREYFYPTDEVMDVAYEMAEHFDLSRLTSSDFPDLHQIARVADALVVYTQTA